MKICKFVEGSFIPALDGASEKFSQISEYLSQAGIEVTIIHCYRGWSDLRMISRQNFKTFAISPKYYYQDHQVIKKIISQIKPDLIEMNDMELIVSTGLFLNSQFNIPLLFDAHFVSSALVKDLTGNRKAIDLEKKLEQEVGKVVSGIICFTKLDRDNFLSSAKITPSRVRVIPLGSNSKTIKFRKLGKKDKTILFLGNMFFQPNQQAVEYTIQEILPNILKRYPDTVFKFVGDVPQSLKNKYQNKQIIFTGRVSDINQVFLGARVCLAPILTGGGMRVKVLTYMASGVPVVVSRIGAEGISNLSVVRLAETPEEFSRGVIELLEDYSFSSELGKKARALVTSEYSWESIGQSTIDFYQKVIANPVYSKLKPRKVLKEPFWLTETIQKGRFKKHKINTEVIYELGFNRTNKLTPANV